MYEFPLQMNYGKLTDWGGGLSIAEKSPDRSFCTVMILEKKFAFLLILFLQLPLFARGEDRARLEENILLQILLDQAGFSPGEIDGKIGNNTLKALHTYQTANGLPHTGKADDRTLDLLSASGRPTLRNYRLTAQDVRGPVTQVRAAFMQKAKLPAKRDASALEGISEKFHLSPDLFLVLNPDATLVEGETVVVPNVLKQSIPPKAIKRVGGKIGVQ